MKFDRIFEQASALNMNWLLYGEGPPRNQEGGEHAGDQSAADPPVPYYRSTALQPDDPSELDEEQIYLGFPASFIHEELDTDPNDLFLTRAMGDGMEPTIRDREFMLVKRSAERPFAGRIYLIRLDGSLLCKRLFEEPGNRLRLMNDNNRYQDIHMERDEAGLDIVGRVIWHGRQV